MGHYWTLEVELVFYVLCALLYLLIGGIHLWTSLLCLGLTLLARYYELLGHTTNHWPFLGNDLSIMFWGCCCRMVYDRQLPARLGRLARPLGIAIVVLSTLLVLREPLEWLRIGFMDGSPGHRRLGWGYGLGILLFLGWVLVGRVRSRFLERIGKGTYSIYLLHPVVFYIVLKGLNSPNFSFLRDHHLGFYLAVLIPLCVVAGMLGYRWVEVPSDMLRRLLTKPALESAAERR